MRFIHTSDWHLGRTLRNVDLTEYQLEFHRFLIEKVEEHQVDAVLIAGDVYDRSVAPETSVEALSRVLSKLSSLCKVIITPGNHDSATRLGFGAALMRDGMHFQTRIAGIEDPVVLEDEFGPVLCFGIPFLEPETARTYYSTESLEIARSHEAVTTCAMEVVKRKIAEFEAHHAGKSKVRSIVLAHTFVSGGNKSDSERDLTVGGVDSVPGTVFNGVNYVALGHLHGKQNVTSLLGEEASAFPTQAWYSGSPLAFSFSEINHQKSILLVDLAADGTTEVTPIPTPVPRQLTELKGTFEELTVLSLAHRDDWVKLTVIDGHKMTDLNSKLREHFPHFLEIEIVRTNDPLIGSKLQAVSREASPKEVLGQFYEQLMGSELDSEQLEIIEDILRDLNQGRN